ncbi:hypothetical protein RIF29_47161 [Crotalaria pallida]|uniref:Uncharacterized protein n=1 Tax=Crotalaria pallida TaxID=3830 RepID=A0AAN9HKB7_CROPI
MQPSLTVGRDKCGFLLAMVISNSVRANSMVQKGYEDCMLSFTHSSLKNSKKERHLQLARAVPYTGEFRHSLYASQLSPIELGLAPNVAKEISLSFFFNSCLSLVIGWCATMSFWDCTISCPKRQSYTEGEGPMVTSRRFVYPGTVHSCSIPKSRMLVEAKLLRSLS